jgi:hypothetical protein
MIATPPKWDLADEVKILIASIEGADGMTTAEHPEIVPVLRQALVVLLEVRAMLDAFTRETN